MFGIPLATSWWSLLIGLYGYALPGFLYAAWLTIALWDLIRQESVPISSRARWMAVVILVPFLGPLLYFAFGRSPIPKQLRSDADRRRRGGRADRRGGCRARRRLRRRRPRVGCACACWPCPWTRSSPLARGRPRRSSATWVPPSACLSMPSISITRIGSTDSGISETFVRIRSGSLRASARGRKLTCTGTSSARRRFSFSSICWPSSWLMLSSSKSMRAEPWSSMLPPVTRAP